MDQVTIDVRRSILLGPKDKARRKRSNAVFIAYRMNDPASRDMRTKLERSIREIDSEVMVMDGKVLQGLPWADEVRKRISRSRLLVIDVTGPSREVMFEMGFASNKPFIPVVHLPEDRDSLPSWLTAFQISTFAGTGLPLLAADVVSALRAQLPKSTNYNRPPAAPGMVVWLENTSYERFGNAYERVIDLARRYSLDMLKVDPRNLQSYDDLRQVLRAWMVISCLDGRSSDHAGHFFLGDIAGRRRAGSGSGRGQSLYRHGVALVPTEADLSLFIADSVRRVGRGVLTSLHESNVAKELEPIFASYRRWLLSDQGEL